MEIFQLSGSPVLIPGIVGDNRVLASGYHVIFWTSHGDFLTCFHLPDYFTCVTASYCCGDYFTYSGTGKSRDEQQQQQHERLDC